METDQIVNMLRQLYFSGTHTHTPLILRMVDYVKEISSYLAEWLDECLIFSMVPDLVPEVGTRAMHEEEKSDGGKEKRQEWKEWETMRWPRLVSMLGVTNSETSLLGLRTKMLPNTMSLQE